jgi:hypothetical protein
VGENAWIIMEAGGLSSPWVLGRLHLTSCPTHLNVKDRRKPGLKVNQAKIRKILGLGGLSEHAKAPFRLAATPSVE